MMDIKTVDNYIESNKDRFLDELIDLLKIPSVSADPAYSKDVHRAAELLSNRLKEIGIDKVEICPTVGYPIVYGEKIVDEKLPTVLVYGHYDVQPADPIELWDSPPFEPIIKDGKIYARGACDDKGQMYMHIKAVELMLKTDGLPCNVKFMIEGEEEVGSDNLGLFVKANKERLKADLVLISDTGMIANDVPSLTVGLRGLSYIEVEVTGPKRDLHSGLYGGAVGNPINILCDMIASLMDENKQVTIPGFYDGVIEVSAEERAEMAKAPFSEQEYCDELDMAATQGEAGYSTLERATIRPTMDVNGIWGGYTGDGAKTVLPSKVYAKISCRLVPGQDPDKITDLLINHIENMGPDCVKVKVTPHHGGQPYLTPTEFTGYKAAHKAMEITFGKTPIPMRSGGSIPIVAMFEEELGLKSVLMGFGLDSDAIHSPNEHYGIFNYLKGIQTIPFFYQNLAELS
ncbi:MAG: acetylornithine deacetylase/succinyl-diaminopimelate desuccinylase-like protein [Bacteroidia bacterium]|jgi:acetylornithine deacetylase/succinyl-diaminopimelate desuccinylase-like protein